MLACHSAATVATEATVSLHFFVAGLPCLYFLGFGADAMKMCAGERDAG